MSNRPPGDSGPGEPVDIPVPVCPVCQETFIHAPLDGGMRYVVNLSSSEGEMTAYDPVYKVTCRRGHPYFVESGIATTIVARTPTEPSVSASGAGVKL